MEVDRIIEIKVNGNYVTKDGKNAGTQGEGNTTALRIEFDAGWDGYAKTVTFWNARGENPVSRVLTADILEDILASTRVYLCPIPPEAMAIWGECMFAIDGYINGKRQISAYAKLVVKPNGTGIAAQIEQPTPTQIEQLQVQIDTMLADMQERAVRAETAADAAEVSEANAKASEVNAKASEENAKASELISVDSAKQAALSAETAREIAGGNVATLSDIKRAVGEAEEGLVSKSGDTMNGDLTIHKDVPVVLLECESGASATVQKNANTANDFGTEVIDRKSDGVTFAKLVIDAAGSDGKLKLVLSDGSVFCVYHEGHKPEPQEIGAADEIAGLFQNDLRWESGLGLLSGATGGVRLESQSSPYDSMNARALEVRNHTGASLKKALALVTKNPTDGNSTYSIYGEHNPPREVVCEVEVGGGGYVLDTASGYYVKEINVPEWYDEKQDVLTNLFETDNPNYDVVHTDNAAADALLDGAFNKIADLETFDGKIRLKARANIETALAISLKVVR